MSARATTGRPGPNARARIMLASKQPFLSMPSPAPAPLLLDADSAGRLRAVIGRLSRRLRPTPSGLEAGLSPTRISLLLSLVRLDRIRLSELGELEGLNP